METTIIQERASAPAGKKDRMKHFGTDIIRDLRVCQAEGSRQFCHASHTVLCPMKGDLQITEGGRRDHFTAPGVLLIPSGREVSLACAEPSSFLVIQLSPVFLMEAFSRDRLLSETISSAEYPELANVLHSLLELVPVYLNSPDRNRLAVNRILFAFLEDLDRILCADPQEDGMADQQLQSRQKAVDAYITANIEKQISLQETAATCGLTPQYLSSFYQKSMQCTFMEYINRIKAEKACEWLLRSDIPAEEVSEIAGFKTYSAFRKSIQARFGRSWEDMRLEQVRPVKTLPEEDCIQVPSWLSFASVRPAVPENIPPAPRFDVRQRSIDAVTRPDNLIPDSWRMILNIGSADSLFFDPFLRKLDEINRTVSFRYCRMYGLLQLVTVYGTDVRTYYGFELVFQNLDAIIRSGLIPFLDLGFRDFPGHRNPVSTFAFNSDPIDMYYDKLLLILPEFLKAAANRYGREAVGKWCLEFHFSYQNNRNYTYWQFLSMFRKIESAARAVLPDITIGGLGFDAAVHPGTFQSMLEQLHSLSCRIDFISIHVNGLVLPKINGSGSYRFTDSPDEINRRVSAAVSMIRRYYDALPVYVTEFGFAHFLRSSLNDSLFQTSFILRFLLANYDKVQGMGYHMLDDLGEPDRPSGREFFGCAGMYSAHGLRKPSYYAYDFFSRLGRSALSAGEDYIVTALSRFNYRILAFHYRHITPALETLHETSDVLAFEESCTKDAQRLQFHFHIRGAVPGQYIIKALRLKAGSGSLHKLWLYHPNCLGRLDETDYEFFRQNALPDAEAQICTVTGIGELTADLLLAPMETVLLLIDRSPV